MPADERSILLLRSAIVSMALTLVLVPGGVRALRHTPIGWEAWSFSRFLILPIILSQALCCWMPLARRYFKAGECHDIPAFFIASAALFAQALVGYALFASHILWNAA